MGVDAAMRAHAITHEPGRWPPYLVCLATMALQSPESRKHISTIWAQEFIATRPREVCRGNALLQTLPLFREDRNQGLSRPALHELLPSCWRFTKQSQRIKLGRQELERALHVFHNSTSPRRRRPATFKRCSWWPCNPSHVPAWCRHLEATCFGHLDPHVSWKSFIAQEPPCQRMRRRLSSVGVPCQPLHNRQHDPHRSFSANAGNWISQSSSRHVLSGSIATCRLPDRPRPWSDPTHHRLRLSRRQIELKVEI